MHGGSFELLKMQMSPCAQLKSASRTAVKLFQNFIFELNLLVVSPNWQILPRSNKVLKASFSMGTFKGNYDLLVIASILLYPGS